jgi:uncharacterized membrane protein YbhN (UPF0104 family)
VTRSRRLATLTLAGVSAGQAVVATAAYRVVSYFLPVVAGAAAYAWHKVDPLGAGSTA